MDQGVIRLEGRCRLEDAEMLLNLISEDRKRPVDLAACTYMHTAIAQLLLALRPEISGEPDDPFLRHHLLPLL